jgi:hypothetical protein
MTLVRAPQRLQRVRYLPVDTQALVKGIIKADSPRKAFASNNRRVIGRRVCWLVQPPTKLQKHQVPDDPEHHDDKAL